MIKNILALQKECINKKEYARASDLSDLVFYSSKQFKNILTDALALNGTFEPYELINLRNALQFSVKEAYTSSEPLKEFENIFKETLLVSGYNDFESSGLIKIAKTAVKKLGDWLGETSGISKIAEKLQKYLTKERLIDSKGLCEGATGKGITCDNIKDPKKTATSLEKEAGIKDEVSVG